MLNYRINAAFIAIVFLMSPLFFASTAEAKTRSCSSSSVAINGTTEVGSTWVSITHPLPDSYLQTRAAVIMRFSPEKTRKKACVMANKATVAYARTQHTIDDMARLMCATAKSNITDRHSNAGNQVKLRSVTASSTRERNSNSHPLGNQIFSCDQYEVPVEQRKNSQFCQNYATSAIKMDLAIEQLGCPVQHAPEDGHKNYCSERSDETVSNGIKYKRNVLNMCLDKLPLH